MDYWQMFIDLIAYAQRQGILSSTSAVYHELADITGYDVDEIEAALSY